MKKNLLLFSLLLIILLTGCQSLYMTTLEKFFGVEKRQLLSKYVDNLLKEEQQAKVEFKDALTRLKESYTFDGGSLEKNYNKIKTAYTNAKSRADAVHQRIVSMDNVARSMFSEWKNEIKKYNDKGYARESKTQLSQTKARYESLLKTARASEATMKPVLAKLYDHVLYLKHNLNAKTIGSFKTETMHIEDEIEKLIRQINASILQADIFIKDISQL